ncbi:hypothetical protein BMETH_1365_0 [methanotrophic bacterial endosymbiont of Bathymodiolus sp.]|nr:hypothetical protein BMETH_1365_0 [methanotrophic bacterial endosymbiont of Bathymodiolus sp.]
MIVMQVAFMTDHTHDDIGFCCAGNGNFIAVFILLVVFAFAYAVNSGLM